MRNLIYCFFRSVIIQVQFLWSYKHKTIPFLQDSGSGIIKVTQSDSAISLEIYTENGMARVKVKNSYINIQEFSKLLMKYKFIV